MNRYEMIRAFYAPVMRKLALRTDEWMQDPYAWDRPDSGIVLTPIEQALWSDIRSHGAVFYPQVPVGRYFVDFGNPAAKVAIECDGAQWHTDKDRDARRQADIQDLGWKVYRISGRDCLAETVERQDERGRPHVDVSTGSKFVEYILKRHPVKRGCCGLPPVDLAELLELE